MTPHSGAHDSSRLSVIYTSLSRLLMKYPAIEIHELNIATRVVAQLESLALKPESLGHIAAPDCENNIDGHDFRFSRLDIDNAKKIFKRV